MFEEEAKRSLEEIRSESWFSKSYSNGYERGFQDGAEFGYNKANEWHYVKDGDLPRQYEHTCFSVEVLANNKKWVYYEFGSGKWFCGNKEVKVIAWKEIIPPELKENENENT